MSNLVHIIVDIPFAYPRRDQLVAWLQSKFPGAEISVVHKEIDEPQVAETLVEHDQSLMQKETAEKIASEDSRSVMQEVAASLSEFNKAV